MENKTYTNTQILFRKKNKGKRLRFNDNNSISSEEDSVENVFCDHILLQNEIAPRYVEIDFINGMDIPSIDYYMYDSKFQNIQKRYLEETITLDERNNEMKAFIEKTHKLFKNNIFDQRRRIHFKK